MLFQKETICPKSGVKAKPKGVKVVILCYMNSFENIGTC